MPYDDRPLEEKIENWFIYHQPAGKADIDRYARIRDAGKVFALVLAADTPGCPDQTVAIRKVREAVMVANAAIACGGK